GVSRRLPHSIDSCTDHYLWMLLPNPVLRIVHQRKSNRFDSKSRIDANQEMQMVRQDGNLIDRKAALRCDLEPVLHQLTPETRVGDTPAILSSKDEMVRELKLGVRPRKLNAGFGPKAKNWWFGSRSIAVMLGLLGEIVLHRLNARLSNASGKVP